MDDNFYNPFKAEEKTEADSRPKRIKQTSQVKKTTSNLTYLETPLSQELKEFIRTIVQNDNLDKIICTVENVSENYVGIELFNQLNYELQSFLGDETKKIVNKILFFRTRPCKAGIYCGDLHNCIFMHDINKEVIINRVPKNAAKQLYDYCAKYGAIDSFRQLNPQKFLVEFNNQNDALEFIKDKKQVLADENIKKFFNKKDTNIFLLINEQEDLIDSLLEKKDKIGVKMKISLHKMKEFLLPNEKSNNIKN